MATRSVAERPLLVLEDENTKCASLLATIHLDSYIDLVEEAYLDQGGLSGQRAPIRTKTAQKIRSRLVQDLRNGAVIPPVVVGVVCTAAQKRRMKNLKNSTEIVELLKKEKLDISIIDGMQRTTALKEAFDDKKHKHFIRVEIWVAEKVSSLIYRMLVLNTGQVPWDLKRQLDTLYRPILSEVTAKLPQIKVIGLDEPNRRSQAGEYRSTRVVELFLAFTSRSVEMDIKEKIAEEFIKIDITEATSSDEFLPLFIKVLSLMAKFDEQFQRIKVQSSEMSVRVKSGKDIFTSLPSSIGFVVAIAEIIFGAPGFDYKMDVAIKDLARLEKTTSSLIKYMQKLDASQLAEFADFETLNQLLGVKSGKVGDYERQLYKRAFATLLTKSKEIIVQGSMTPCWKAR